MPEAAMHEQCDATARKDKIGVPRQRPRVEPVAKPHGMKIGANA